MKNLTLIITFFGLMHFGARAQCPIEFHGQETLDVNNVKSSFTSVGSMWRDTTDYAQFYYPNDTSKTRALFAGSIWVGGIDDGGLIRTSAQTYRQSSFGYDFAPGPLDGPMGGDSAICNAWDRVWKIDGGDLLSFASLTFPVAATSVPPSILEWPGKGNPFAKGKDGSPITVSGDMAPFIDTDMNGIYDPRQGDLPNIKGDQAVFWVCNDMGGKQTASDSQAVGLQLRNLAYAYSHASAGINQSIFYDISIDNLTRDLNDAHVGFWVDVDLGWFLDDMVGVDTLRDLAYAYNGDSLDGSGIAGAGRWYDDNPPVVGLKIVKRDSSFSSSPSFFLRYANDFTEIGNPESDTDYYNYMSGKWKNDSLWTQSPPLYGTGPAIRHYYPDAPGGTGFNMCNDGLIGDIRFVFSLGSVDLKKGKSYNFTYATTILDQDSTQVNCKADISSLQHCADVIGDSLSALDKWVEDLNVHIGTGFGSTPTKRSVRLFPNPTSSMVRIESEDGRPYEELIMIDLNGRVVLQEKLNDSQSFNVEQLSGGLYSVILIDKNGLRSIEKLNKL